MNDFLSPNQKRVLAAALTLAGVAAILIGITLGIQQLGRLVSIFSPLLWPLATAGILAMLLQPVVTFMETRLKLNRIASVLVLYALVVSVAAVSLILLVPLLFGQLNDLVEKIPTLWNAGATWVDQRLPEWINKFDTRMPGPPLAERIPEWTAQLRDAVLNLLPTPQTVGDQVLGIFGAITGLAIIPVYLFFFLQTSLEPTRSLSNYLPFLKEDTREDVVFLVREFISLIVLFFRGQLLIGLIMGIVLASGFSIAGLKFGLLIGLSIGLLNVIPYLGSILGMAIALPIAFFQPEGGLTTALLVVGVFAGTQALEGWYLTPKIMGQNTGLHPVVIILAIFFWGIALGGILGMILAIPLTAFFVTAWRLAKRKYIRPIA